MIVAECWNSLQSPAVRSAKEAVVRALAVTLNVIVNNRKHLTRMSAMNLGLFHHIFLCIIVWVKIHIIWALVAVCTMLHEVPNFSFSKLLMSLLPSSKNMNFLRCEEFLFIFCSFESWLSTEINCGLLKCFWMVPAESFILWWRTLAENESTFSDSMNCQGGRFHKVSLSNSRATKSCCLHLIAPKDTCRDVHTCLSLTSLGTPDRHASRLLNFCFV